MTGYFAYGDVWFKNGTPIEVADALYEIMHSSRRPKIRVYYGNQDNGVDWCISKNNIGYLGIVNGSWRVYNFEPLDSSKANELKTQHIIRITMENREEYRHPAYASCLDIRHNIGEHPTVYKMNSSGNSFELLAKVKDMQSARIVYEYYKGIRNSLDGAIYRLVKQNLLD